jgi:hypothetical protein
MTANIAARKCVVKARDDQNSIGVKICPRALILIDKMAL